MKLKELKRDKNKNIELLRIMYEKMNKDNNEETTFDDKIVEGSLNKDDDIKKADFNGIYVIYKKTSQEIIYIGSAYPKGFPISKRLKIHLKGNSSNTQIVDRLAVQEGISTEEAKNKLRVEYGFIAYPYDSIEYRLIEYADGLFNKKGNKKNKEEKD